MIDLFALEILPLKRRTAQEGIPLPWLLSQHQGEGIALDGDAQDRQAHSR